MRLLKIAYEDIFGEVKKNLQAGKPLKDFGENILSIFSSMSDMFSALHKDFFPGNGIDFKITESSNTFACELGGLEKDVPFFKKHVQIVLLEKAILRDFEVYPCKFTNGYWTSISKLNPQFPVVSLLYKEAKKDLVTPKFMKYILAVRFYKHEQTMLNGYGYVEDFISLLKEKLINYSDMDL